MNLNPFSKKGEKKKPIEPGADAPRFVVKNHQGEVVSLEDRRGKGWTVLYFYPKADTPGCTKQACVFRDATQSITELGAKIYGISTDSEESQKKFHDKYHLSFDLLADSDGQVAVSYGTRVGVLNVSRRWTYLIDPDLVVRYVDRDVDPAVDAKRVSDKLKELQQA